MNCVLYTQHHQKQKNPKIFKPSFCKFIVINYLVLFNLIVGIKFYKKEFCL